MILNYVLDRPCISDIAIQYSGLRRDPAVVIRLYKVEEGVDRCNGISAWL